MTRMLLAILAVATLTPSLASAQSKKYPTEKPDKDREAEQKSRVWESALHPERRTYDELVDHARAGAKHQSPERAKAAIVELDKAIALQPTKPEAYQVRGEAHANLKEWAKCADDLVAAESHRTAEPDDQRLEQRKSLGTCLARAGRYNAAEQRLAQAVASGSKDYLLLMRLGEVRIALGKLDEAITILTAALDSSDTGRIRWLLATAYDRARMPSQVAEQLAAGYRNDSRFQSIMTPALGEGPFLGTGETEYMLGLAWGATEPPTTSTSYANPTVPRPDIQLIYFQKFLKLAPDSPWRKRAEEHVRELRTVSYPETIAKRGSAPLDLDVTRTMLRKGMPAMRACMVKAPGMVLNVVITRVGPRSPATVRPPPSPYYDPFDTRGRRAPMSTPPAPGVTITQKDVYNFEDVTRAEIDNTMRCIEKLAEKIALPPIKEKDTYFAIEFNVVAP
ncbi:MAG: tetratricopeptide repeat protein [Deltaproteobacteria bacterium]|nr:tetratricopeptide repeat protein [Deltaproteobacteria bacterium]